ncbi:glycosyltransferase family 1 protein [soil metagenome]
MSDPPISLRDLPLILGYDASSTTGPRTGVGVYTAELLNALAEELPDRWRIRAFVNSRRHPLPDDPWTRSPRIDIRAFRRSGKLLLRSWQFLGGPPIERFVDAVELYHSPAGYVTPSRNARRVISVHDLFFRGHPEVRDAYGGRYFDATYPKGLPLQDRIITFARTTADELTTAYAIDPARIVVIPHGVDARFFTPEKDDDALPESIRGKEVFLAVGSAGPRKNHVGLIEGYAQARQNSDAARFPLLVMVGHVDAASAAEIAAAVEKHKLGGAVVLPGYVSNLSLRALYRRAVALVVPSHSEGFGLPLLEAMACGCPVIAAKAGSLPEVAADAAILVPPGDDRALADALRQIAGNSGARERLVDAGIARAKLFTWRAAAHKTIAVYEDVLSEHRPRPSQ